MCKMLRARPCFPPFRLGAINPAGPAVISTTFAEQGTVLSDHFSSQDPHLGFEALSRLRQSQIHPGPP